MRNSNRVLTAVALLALAAPGANAWNVNKSINIEAGAQTSGNSTVNGSVTVGAGAIVTGSLETVNGSIRIAENVQVESASTVNGSIRIESGLVTDSIESVNGTIRIGPMAQISGSVEVVNGKIALGQGSRVGRDIANVNGEVSLESTEVGGDIRTVTGDVTVNGGSQVQGDIIIEKPGGWGWNRRKQKPRVIIGPGARVDGTIVAEHEIELYISESASVGGVSGEVSMDDAIRFGGDRP